MRRGPVVVLLSVVVLAGGCADGGGGVFSSTTGGATTTATTAPPTTAPTTTTVPLTTAAPVFVVGTPSVFPPVPLVAGPTAPCGSGCPPEGAPLPDGVWFGRLHEVAPGAGRFDPACFYFGEAAEAAAADDGEGELPSPHYIRDLSAGLVDVAIAPGAVAYSIDNSVDPLGFMTLSLDEWPTQNGGYTLCPGEGCSVWLYVNSGLVTEIIEQYLP